MDRHAALLNSVDEAAQALAAAQLRNEAGLEPDNGHSTAADRLRTSHALTEAVLALVKGYRADILADLGITEAEFGEGL